jgi:hypothetical protein
LWILALAAACSCVAAPPVARAQNQGDPLFQTNANARAQQRFSTVQQPVSDAPGRFIRPGAAVSADDRQPGLTPLASGAGITGYDATNARRIRARRAAAASAPSLSAAQVVTVRELSRGAPQRFRREIVPPPIIPGSLAPPVLVPVHRFPPTPQDYYAPLGIRSGSFTLYPAVELIGGYDSNPQRLNAGGPGSYFTSVNPALSVRSNWARHALNAEMRGSYIWYSRTWEDIITGTAQTADQTSVAVSGLPRSLDRPSMEARVNGRLDTYELSHADAEARFSLGTDNPGSPNVMAGLSKLPIYTRVGGSLGYTQNFNRLDVTLKGGADRVFYQESELTDGTTSSNDDREYHQFTASLRGSYDLTPGVRPFIEAAIDTRRHELPVDRNGIRRDSDAWTARAGSTFEFSRIMTGEASAGWIDRKYKDPSLPEVTGLVADASLIWLPSALTTVTLTARSGTDESIVAAVSGVLRRDFAVQVDHSFRRWLIGTFRTGMGFDTYESNTTPREDERFFVSAALVYKLSREMQVRGELRRDWLKSNITSVDYEANAALIGVKWQQ